MRKLKKALLSCFTAAVMACSGAAMTSCLFLPGLGWTTTESSSGDPTISPGDTVEDGVLAYRLLSDGTYSVRAADVNLTSAEIPASYNGIPVTVVEEGAFNVCVN